MISKSLAESMRLEDELWRKGMRLVAGVDEAGRGPLAGPVVAAAVVFPRKLQDVKNLDALSGIDDSKKLTASDREELIEVIQTTALSIGIGIVSHQVIDEINILNATFRSMHEAVARLDPPPDHLLIDGPRFAGADIPFTAIVNGDATSLSIAAASIVAKVVRDRLMREYDLQFPQYGFAKHKGYGTREHLEAIRKHGPCEIHRRSFRMPLMVGVDAD